MKKLAAFILLGGLSLGCAEQGLAQTGSNPMAHSRASQKAERKQLKAQKKYAKAQGKAQRKMLKTERKNTHYPPQSF
jgi:hypothetical protein